MNSSNNPSELYNKAKTFWNHVVNKEPAEEQKHTSPEAHRRMFTIFQNRKYYYFVFNIFKADFENMSSSVEEALGYRPEEMNAVFFIQQIHPDDKPYFLKFEKCVTEFFKTRSAEQIAKYKVQYDLRIKTKEGEYIRILHQVVQIEYDQDNFYRCLDLHTDITDIKSDDTPVFSLIGFGGEHSYFNIQEGDGTKLTPSVDPFTTEERALLKLIIEGVAPEGNAQQLSTNEDMQDGKQHLMAKLKVDTTDALVSKVITEGWL